MSNSEKPPSTAFVDSYVQQAAVQLSALIKKPLTEKQLEKIRQVTQTRLVNRPIIIANPHKKIRNEADRLRLANFILDRKHKPILTGAGTMFKPHAEHKSIIGDMISMLMSRRKVEKNLMFKLISEGRPDTDPEVEAKDQAQKIFKLLANSFYGAMGEKGFTFFDPVNGPATTYTGQLIISSTLYGFEGFMSGNLWLRNEHELVRHVALCLKSVEDSSGIESEWGTPPFDTSKIRESVTESLIAACTPFWNPRECIASLLEECSDEELYALLFRGNPYYFLHLPKAAELLSITLQGNIPEADGGKMEKSFPEGKAAIEKIFEGMKKWVMIPHVPGDLPRRVGEMTRKVVVLTDTDSTFINLHPWMEFLGSVYDLQDASEDILLTGLNVAVYLLRIFNDHQMAELTKALNVPEDKRKLINFKSEFVIKRMVLTDGKKNYAALLRFQEGVRIEGDSVELKGLAMKKTTVARSTGQHFENAIEHMVLRPDKIDRTGIVREIVKLEQKIRQVMLEGSTEYSTPGNLGRINEYRDKYSMPVVRGMMAWNAAMPNTPIREGDRVNMFRLEVGTDATKLTNEMDNWPVDSSEYQSLKALADLFFDVLAIDGIGLHKNGLNWLAIPKDQTSAPTWARRLISVSEVLQANCAPINPILESIGIRVLRRPDPQTYSNVISF